MVDNRLELKKLREMLGSLPSKSQVAPEEIIDALSYGVETPGQIQSRVRDLSGDLLMERYNLSPNKDVTKTYQNAFDEFYPDIKKKPIFDVPVTSKAVAETGSDLQIKVNPSRLTNPQRAVQNALHEGRHVQEILDEVKGKDFSYNDLSPKKRSLISKLYDVPDSKLDDYMMDPAMKLKAMLAGHHKGEFIKGLEPEVISRILTNQPITKKEISLFKKALGTGVKTLGKGVKQIPLIGQLLGIGIAAATGDAEAAFPDIAAPTWTGPEKDSLQSIVENPEDALSMDEKEYKELIKAIRNQQE